MHPRQPVVITGVGLRCAAGPLPQLPDRCYGRPHPDATALGVLQIATVHDVQEDPDFPDDRKGSLAAAALGDLPLPDGARRGIWLGTGLSSMTPDELVGDLFPHLEAGQINRERVLKDLRPDRPSPRRHMPERVAQVLAARMGAAYAETSFSACAAAAQAIAAAARAVGRGDVDVAVAGGHDSMAHPLGLLSFVVLGALSLTVARPFDRRRDGFMLGEGAALFMLEREADARARGAPILARWLGAGTSVDAWNVTAPHPEGRGAELAMRRALQDAGIYASDVDYVNAHGTGTPIGDKAESMAIHRVFGDVPVSSFKGAVGHTIAAAGAVELALSLGCFTEGRLPGTVGLEEPDPACPAQVLVQDIPCGVDGSGLPRGPRALLSNSFGFGGQNCAVILGAP